MIKYYFITIPLLIIVCLLCRSSGVVIENVQEENLNRYDNNTSSSLELVAILFRHGHRGPDRFFKSDPFKLVKRFWPLGLGQLTLKGKRQLYRLGRLFRQRYKLFVNEYTTYNVRVNSSDADRCHMSAGCLLAGWFPPASDQLWTKTIHWQPIPIHSTPGQEDRIIGLTASCPRYDQEKAKVDEEIAAKETSKDKKLFRQLSQHMKETISTTAQVAKYYNTMLIEEISGHKLPHWTSKFYPQPMKSKAAIALSSWSWNDFMKRITGGPMIKEIANQMTLKSKGKNKLAKLFLYSGHEDTIIGVWRALGFTEHILPGFGASLIFELHKNKYSGYFVKVFYMENYVATPHALQVPHCKSPCHLNKLLSVTKHVRGVDWNKDCVAT